jgi:hypothetical protein
MATATDDKIEKLKQYDDGPYWSVKRVTHNGINYAVINDGANRYVLEYNDIHGVDELLDGELDYSSWCASNYTFDGDADIPTELQCAIRDQVGISREKNICIKGSL